MSRCVFLFPPVPFMKGEAESPRNPPKNVFSEARIRCGCESMKFLLHRRGDQLVKRGSILSCLQKTLSRGIIMASVEML